jgi:hypothetical protein
MSSVIDVGTMAAPDSLYHEIGLSFFNTSALSAGHTKNGRGQWIVSARRSNLDLLYENFSRQLERPRYIDAFAKINYEISDRLSITGSVLRSSDDLSLADDIDREERANADHSDTYIWVTLDHTLRNGFRGRTLVARTELNSERVGTSRKQGLSTGSLNDRREFSINSLQSDWSFGIGDNWAVDMGAALANVDGTYTYADQVAFDLLIDIEGAPDTPSRSRSLLARPEGSQVGLHGAIRHRFSDRLTADLGLRWDAQTLSPVERATLGPRFGIRFALTPRTELRTSIGRFYQSQGINELQVSDGVVEYKKPQRSDHIVVGIQHDFSSRVSLRVEAYNKQMTNLRPRYENVLNSRVLLPELKPDRVRIAPENAVASGIEFMLDGSTGNSIEWWVAYSWSQVQDRINGVDVDRSWDQPHSVRGGLKFDLKKWSFSLGADYRAGWPTTRLSLDDSGSIPIAVSTGRNSARHGNYASADVLIKRDFELERSTVSLSFEVTNVFDRNNACCVEFEIGDGNEAGQLTLKNLSYLPTVPSIGLLWKF